MADETTETRRTSDPEETFGEEPYAYSGHLNGAPTASTASEPSPATKLAKNTAAGSQSEHTDGSRNATEKDLNSRSQPPVCPLITDQSLSETNTSKPSLPSSSMEQIIPVEPSELRTTFKMAIHMEGEQMLKRMVQLDTGSSVNLLSELVLADLGMPLEPWDGKVIPLGEGEPIWPLGKVTLDWHVIGKPKTYKDTFLVIDAASSEDFDVLLSRDTIGRVGFYKTDDKVWVLNQGSR